MIFPLVSIIVPIYNVEKYLNRCIESICHQTYKNLEIILVDDGSEDRSSFICNEWAEKDERIMVIHKENGGLSDARNIGIDMAHGKYIAFVDGDDWIKPYMYEKLINCILKKNADIAICNFEYVNEKDEKIERDIKRLCDEEISGTKALEKLSIDGELNYVVVWNKLYSYESIKNIRFPVGKVNEDEFIMHRVLYNAKKIVCCSNRFYQYVQHDGSIMSSKINVKRLDAIEGLVDRYEFYKNHNMQQLLDDVILKLEAHYIFLRSHLWKMFSCRQDRNKIRKIDVLFRKIYLNESSKNLKSYIKAYCPHLVFYGRRCKILISVINYAIKIRSSKSMLIDTPTHGNLGDHAIVLAEQQFLKKYRIRTCELGANALDHRERWYAKLTPMNKCIFVPGGGFLGTLWPNEEERFRRILRQYKNNKVVVFPQTVTFDLNTEVGRSYLKESQEIYSSHPDLTIFVREHKSYDFMQKYFPTVKCILVPDIVTILDTNIHVKGYKRSGMLLCMRSDLEKSLSKDDVERIEKLLKQKYPDQEVEYTDTVVPYSIRKNKRKQEVKKKLEQFKSSKLIITDRLHGMVFSALTDTPCIAFGNINGKVKNVYEWIKENKYIQFVENIAEFQRALDELDINLDYTYNKRLVEKDFEPLIKMVEELKG